jgi:uroporphyrinogen decarboxylase
MYVSAIFFREPDFENVLKVMRRDEPERPVLFEIFMNKPLYELVNGRKAPEGGGLAWLKFIIEAFTKMGYDYCSTPASALSFPTDKHEQLSTRSLNEGAPIHDWATFEKYPWPDPDAFDYSMLRDIKPYLPDGMKQMVMGPCGVLENAIAMFGYDDLCYAMYDDPDLVKALFDNVGSRLARYYELALEFDTVGFVCLNDDWGFNTQTFLSPEQMREYVFPWHKKMIDLSHAAGRPVMLHSCGNMRDVIEDVITMGFDAKHSYEDLIMPVEEAYELWHDRIAIQGGIDLDFICRESADAVRGRSRAMLERVAGRGGYMLGTGNSVPEYLPVDKYFAMLEVATGFNPMK